MRVRWGIDQWLIADTFGREWRFWIARPDDRETATRISRWDLPGEPLFHLIPQAFSDWGARDDETAADLLAIYDALTGSRLCEELPRPTQDRRRRLRHFAPELSRVLYGALEAGVLRFERHEVAWPFPEKEEKPEDRRPGKGGDEADWVEIVAVDAEGQPVSGVRYRVTLSNGAVREGMVNENGKVRLTDVPPGSCEIEFPELDAKSWSK
ncbi:carboxypeptidase-like regulatory domain-containing protein [Pendulispora rubella]|uniref:Carboxypeptidase-like regulatory domain-containing protein n=1 Tax=Pendulispora rubella TaxID=2741070 RepID=A0ABZ2L445_9BACT